LPMTLSHSTYIIIASMEWVSRLDRKQTIVIVIAMEPSFFLIFLASSRQHSMTV
jgi:hypothetical protein